MRNPLFEKQMAQAFEKTAWPYDPAQVAEGLPRHLASDVARGQALGETASHTLTHTLPEIGSAASKAFSTLAAPAETVGPHILNAAGRVGNAISKSPTALRAIGGVAVGAPIALDALETSQRKHQDELMAMNRDPERVLTASLYEFLEKQAELTARNGVRIKEAGAPVDPALKKFVTKSLQINLGRQSKIDFDRNKARDEAQKGQLKGFITKAVKGNRPPEPSFWAATGTKAIEGFTGNIGSGVGKALTEAALGALGQGIGALKDYFITDPKRQALIENLMKTDPTISDAIKYDPKGRAKVLEAYSTMVRFAPTLSTDINAARSFVREAVIGGAGVNYATIKGLIETEKALKVTSHRD